MPLRNPFRRQTETPTLRDRAAGLRALLPRPAQRPEPTSVELKPEEAVDWHNPPPGFMASPAIEPNNFIRIPDGIALELQRLHAIAQTEFERRAGDERAGPRVNDLRRDLRLDALTVAARDAAAFTDAMPASRADPTTPDALTAAILKGWKDLAATPYEREEAWARASEHRDRLIQAVMALPATPETIAPKALACAWMGWVCTERPGQPRGAYGLADQLVFDIQATIMEQSALTPPEAAELRTLDLLTTTSLDLKTTPTKHLASLLEAVGMLADTANAILCQPRCQASDHLNAAGLLIEAVADALGAVVSEAMSELRSREPADRHECSRRLSALAAATIENADPDETAAFARELLAFAGE